MHSDQLKHPYSHADNAHIPQKVVRNTEETLYPGDRWNYKERFLTDLCIGILSRAANVHFPVLVVAWIHV